MNNRNLPLPNVIDNITGSDNIVKMWGHHFQDLFNCLKGGEDVNKLCKDVVYDSMDAMNIYVWKQTLL